jgi:hypothetical protein
MSEEQVQHEVEAHSLVRFTQVLIGNLHLVSCYLGILLKE